MCLRPCGITQYSTDNGGAYDRHVDAEKPTCLLTASRAGPCPARHPGQSGHRTSVRRRIRRSDTRAGCDRGQPTSAPVGNGGIPLANGHFQRFRTFRIAVASEDQNVGVLTNLPNLRICGGLGQIEIRERAEHTLQLTQVSRTAGGRVRRMGRSWPLMSLMAPAAFYPTCIRSLTLSASAADFRQPCWAFRSIRAKPVSGSCLRRRCTGDAVTTTSSVGHT